MTELRTTALHDRHEALGASFTDFGGWLMPVRYSSDLAEHHAVRTAAGLFDISHMAEFLVEGPDAGAFLDYALAGRLSTLADDQAKYSLLLDVDGGIIDDVIVYRHSAERYMVVANAGNRDAVAPALAERSLGFEVEVDDATDHIALIAVQGPAAQAIVEATTGITGIRLPLSELKYYRMTHAEYTAEGVDAAPVHIGRTGYTGEDGFELYIQASSAPALWDELLAAGQPHGLVPAGLAARDTLRLEAGMPLYGHELSRDIVPAQAGLGRVVAADKDDFVGRAGLSAVVASQAPVLVGLVSEGKRAGRAGYAVYSGDTAVGEITSGALSPTLGHPIAMAFVSPRLSEPGTALTIDVRGTRIPATVTALPFYRRAR
jgi:aminomethyltransferase